MLTTCLMQVGCHEFILQDNVALYFLLYTLLILLILLSYWNVISSSDIVSNVIISISFASKIDKRSVVVITLLVCSRLILLTRLWCISVHGW